MAGAGAASSCHGSVTTGLIWSGKVQVILTRLGDGATLVLEVKPKLAEATLTWAVAFNAWREAVAAG